MINKILKICVNIFFIFENYENPQTFFVFVLYCTKIKPQIKPQLKVEIEDGREALLHRSKSTLIRNLNQVKTSPQF